MARSHGFGENSRVGWAFQPAPERYKEDHGLQFIEELIGFVIDDHFGVSNIREVEDSDTESNNGRRFWVSVRKCGDVSTIRMP
jgi:hypothetical protein